MLNLQTPLVGNILENGTFASEEQTVVYPMIYMGRALIISEVDKFRICFDCSIYTYRICSKQSLNTKLY